VSILSAIGGELYQESGYVELKIPNTAIGYQDSTGSYAISLISLDPGEIRLPQDTVPSNSTTIIDDKIEISRFVNVTERMNLVIATQ